MRIALLLVFCLTISCASEAAIVQGNAFPYKNQIIQLHSYSDLVTFTKVEIARFKINQDGSFLLEFEDQATGLFVLQIGRVHSHIFLEAGVERYTVIIPEVPEKDRYNLAVDAFVQSEIFEEGGNLNKMITAVERKLNEGIIDASSSKGPKALKSTADTLIESISKTYANQGSPYFQTYLHYRLAELAVSTGHSRPMVQKTYLNTPLPENPPLSFFNLLNLLFPQYLNPVSVLRHSRKTDRAILAKDFYSLDTTLANDPLLVNDRLRHLVIAIELYEVGAERIYTRELVNAMLDSLVIASGTELIKTISINAQNRINNMAVGTTAPDLEFVDVVGNKHRLSEYRGNFVYLQFFRQLDPETLKQLSLMKVLKEGYGEDIAFISLATDTEANTLQRTSKQFDFEWLFAQVLDIDEVMEDYSLRTLPAYFLIDETGVLAQSPADSPGARIEREFAKIYRVAHPTKNKLFKLQPPPADHEMTEK